MKTKNWNVFGMIISIITIVVGIIFILKPVSDYYTVLPEYTSFGADFYTYQYHATCNVAQNAAAIASILEKFADYFGAAFIFAGLFNLVKYGQKVFAEEDSYSADKKSFVTDQECVFSEKKTETFDEGKNQVPDHIDEKLQE